MSPSFFGDGLRSLLLIGDVFGIRFSDSTDHKSKDTIVHKQKEESDHENGESVHAEVGELLQLFYGSNLPVFIMVKGIVYVATEVGIHHELRVFVLVFVLVFVCLFGLWSRCFGGSFG